MGICSATRKGSPTRIASRRSAVPTVATAADSTTARGSTPFPIRIISTTAPGKRVFDGLAAYHVGGLARFGLGLGDDAVQVPVGYRLSANFFDVLGVQMARGRAFVPDDERLDRPTTVAIISHRLWQTQFEGAPDIIGRAVRLNGRPFTIVGLTQADFNGYTVEAQRLWVPITA